MSEPRARAPPDARYWVEEGDVLEGWPGVRTVVVLAAEGAEHAGSAVHEAVVAIVVLLVLASTVRAVLKRIRLPFTVVLVVIGMLLAAAESSLPSFLEPVVSFQLSGELILFVFVPTLVYESATNLDVRLLRRNLGPVMLLAVPGLLLSTGLIGGLLALLTPLELDVALLVGAILSATDPVAVVALFGQLGAPARLTVLVEGESLFNDATSIVVSRILLGVVASGVVDGATIIDGAVDFVVVFLGGLAVGAALAWLVGSLIGLVETDALLEVPLTVTLAYASFLIAEEWLGVSGVMATVAAGLVMGSWGRTRVSPGVEHLLHEAWEQLAFAANALIFLLVGLRVDLGALTGELSTLAWVVLAMLVARATVVFGLVPVGERLPGSMPVAGSYQTVMWWGGLRGAISLALVLTLPEGISDETDLVALVMGAVLFTLLGPGLTIEPLVVRLGLNRPSLAYRWARAEVALAAARRAQERFQQLRSDGMFAARVGRRVGASIDEEVQRREHELRTLHDAEVDADAARSVLWIRLLTVERAAVWDLFARSHITAVTARRADLGLDLQIEHVRERGELLPRPSPLPFEQRLQRRLVRASAGVPGTASLRRMLETRWTAHDYERAWMRHHVTGRALDELARLEQAGDIPAVVVGDVRATYHGWRDSAAQDLDATAAQFPEFVEAMQERQARRLVIEEQRRGVADEARSGLLPEGAADDLRERLTREAVPLRGLQRGALELDLEQVIRSVPFFADLDDREIAALASRLHQRTLPVDEVLIEQGESGDSLFVIARGVVRATHTEEDGDQHSTTMMAGDFFGEIALLHGGVRTATCRTVTPAAVYELSRATVLELAAEHPAIDDALQAADRARNEALALEAQE